MICDDHEVTDDWNMTRGFCEDVYGNALGVRIVQNALVAFALCQAWGNSPDRFDPNVHTPTPPFKPAGARLLEIVSSYEQNSEEIRRLVGVHTAAELKSAGGVYRVFHESDSLRYDFIIEGPGHGATLAASTFHGGDHGAFRRHARAAPPRGLPPSSSALANGSRLEVGGAQITADIVLSETKQSLALSAAVSSAAIVIAPGDGDGFLSSVLPDDGLQAKFDLGLAWSNERRIHLPRRRRPRRDAAGGDLHRRRVEGAHDPSGPAGGRRGFAGRGVGRRRAVDRSRPGSGGPHRHRGGDHVS